MEEVFESRKKPRFHCRRLYIDEPLHSRGSIINIIFFLYIWVDAQDLFIGVMYTQNFFFAPRS